MGNEQNEQQVVYANDTPIEQVVGSPRALKALKAKGINKVGDIRSLAEVSAIPGVSAGVVAQLSELPIRKDEPANPNADVEEGEHPIVLRSPSNGYIIRLLGGDIIPPPIGMPGRPQIVQPVAIMFRNGAAELTRRVWLMAKHRRDEQKVAQELAVPAEKAPWRGEAIRYLKNRRPFKQRMFAIIE